MGLGTGWAVTTVPLLVDPGMGAFRGPGQALTCRGEMLFLLTLPQQQQSKGLGPNQRVF